MPDAALFAYAYLVGTAFSALIGTAVELRAGESAGIAAAIPGTRSHYPLSWPHALRRLLLAGLRAPKGARLGSCVRVCCDRGFVGRVSLGACHRDSFG